jgi:hypothetical protein
VIVNTAVCARQVRLDGNPIYLILERTLWMGSIDNEKWDTKFITEAFGSFGFQVYNVKMVTEKGTDRVCSTFLR